MMQWDKHFQRIRQCRVCGNDDLTTVLDLGHVPLADRFVAQHSDPRDEPRFPLSVQFCGDCSLVQLQETVDPAVLFSHDYPYYSSVSSGWLAHCRANAEELIETRQLDSHSHVIEIASNDGYLLKNYVRAGIPVLGIDPAPGPAAEATTHGISTIVRFFNAGLARELAHANKHADVIHANNVLAHVSELHEVVEGIRLLLKPQGVAVIEVPYVRDLIDGCQFDTMYHEHLCYFSVTALHRLFEIHALHLNHVRRIPTHGGSLRVYVQPFAAQQPSVAEFLTAELQAGISAPRFYQAFSDRVRRVQRELRNGLEELMTGGATIWGYAAAAKGTTLLNTSGISCKHLRCIVDRNIHKHDLLMPGVRIPICGPQTLSDHAPDYLLLLAWNLRDEIIAEQSAFKQRGGRFIIPIPRFEVV